MSSYPAAEQKEVIRYSAEHSSVTSEILESLNTGFIVDNMELRGCGVSFCLQISSISGGSIPRIMIILMMTTKPTAGVTVQVRTCSSSVK